MEILTLGLSAMGMALATSCFLVLTQGVVLGGSYTMLLSLLPAGVLTLLTMLSFAEMASRFPKNTAGTAMFFIKALGKEKAVWPLMFYLSIIGVVASVEVNLLSALTSAAFPFVDEVFLTLVILLVAYLANIKGWQISKMIQAGSSLILFLLILFLALSGEGKFQQTRVEALDLGALIAMSLFLFFGVEWVTPLGKNKKSYQVSMPVAMCMAVAALGVLYALTLFSGGHLAAEYPLHYSLAFDQFGKGGQVLAMLISFLALFSSFHMGIMGGTKMIYAMGRIKTLPPLFSTVFSDSGRPKGALHLLLVLVLFSNIIIFSLDIFQEVIIAGAIIQCLFYTLALSVQMKLRKNGPPALFKSPLNNQLLRCLQFLYILVAIALMVEAARPHIVLLIFLCLGTFVISLKLPHLRRIGHVHVS